MNSARGHNTRPHIPPHPGPDVDLDPAQIGGLNRAFYQGFKEEAFLARLAVLGLMRGQADELAALMAKGVSWGGFAIEPDDSDAEMFPTYAEIELVALNRHVAETFFRLFWVHARKEPCPWLALAAFRSPGDLRRATDSYRAGELWSDDRSREQVLRETFYGSGAVSDELQASKVAESLSVLGQWIDVAVERIEHAELYNAYKHGLTAVGLESFDVMTPAPDGAGEVSLRVGPGFRYVDRVKVTEPEPRWKWAMVLETVPWETRAAETAILSHLIMNIVHAGAADRGVAGDFRAWVVEPETNPQEIASHGEEFDVARLSQLLRYIER